MFYSLKPNCLVNKWKFPPLRKNSKLQINGQRFIDSYAADVTYKSAYIYPYIFKIFVWNEFKILECAMVMNHVVASQSFLVKWATVFPSWYTMENYNEISLNSSKDINQQPNQDYLQWECRYFYHITDFITCTQAC